MVLAKNDRKTSVLDPYKIFADTKDLHGDIRTQWCCFPQCCFGCMCIFLMKFLEFNDTQQCKSSD